jgi:hypothetical protein
LFIFNQDAPHKGGGKIPAEKCMTDGCGFINRIGLQEIAERAGLEHVPVAVQARVKGAKVKGLVQVLSAINS